MPGDELLGNEFGVNSKCFTSTVVADGITTEDNVRCHRFECRDNTVYIVIKGEYYPCA